MSREYFRDSGRPEPGTSVNKSSYTDKDVIAAPGEGKEIVIMGISLSSGTGSLGTGDNGNFSFWYLTSGSVGFSLGIAVGENNKVSTNLSSGYLSIHYYIRDV